MERLRYALVTGAGRGIGKAVALRLAKDGYRILVNFGSDGELMQFDVTDSSAVETALKSWSEAHPGEYISVVVNNAGIRKDNLMMWMPAEDWHRVLSITLDGFYNVTHPLLKDMILQKWGRIINIVSLSGIKGMAGQTNYSAAKGGLIAATKALSQEVAKKRITVNAVAPGFIRTDMTSDLPEADLKKMIPVGRFGEASEVAELVSFLASENSSYITGEVISINGGLYT